ncbi:outer membrane protein assembly factor BamB family protein [Lignipirellula cremea]|uniref:Outer membrane biogenesis protein BamB n=1 Tax=Lignipirellula cremea TaxID=2528010 RepID=A0A518E045_9BACT|nr:PQQ-binding-like beta-propeller repeat protein [Lignipirellula cremea]QDU97455.1 outer membrane biogenesis protein BamB [Lignipirellula cremea]
MSTPATEPEPPEDQESANQSPAANKAKRRPPRMTPPWHVYLLLLLWVAAIFALPAFGAEWDPAIINLIVQSLGALVFLNALVWFCFFSGHPRLLRYGLLGAIVLLVAGVLTTHRMHTTGAMTVAFERRPWFARWMGDAGRPEPVVTDPTAIELTATPDDYPRFLGIDVNGVIPDVRLARDWQAHPPQELWRVRVGEAWSGFAVVNGYAVTMEQYQNEELITCYRLADGRLEWKHATPGRHDTVMGGIGPRSTPTIDDSKVYALGASAMLSCLDGANGKSLWTVDLREKFQLGSDAGVAWGRAAAPLIVDDLVVVPVGGPPGGPYVSLAAFNKETGELVWQGGEQQVSYSSPMLAEISGVRQILIFNEGTFAGHDPETGKQSWITDWPGNSSGNATCSQPLVVGDDQLLLSKGYGGGSRLIQLSQTAGEWKLETLWEKSSLMKSKYSTPVLYQGALYGLSDGIMQSVDLKAGKLNWRGGRYGYGQILLAGDLLLVVAEDGRLLLLDPTPEKLSELGEIQALEGKTWNTFALSGDLLLLRNSTEAVCYRLQQR